MHSVRPPLRGGGADDRGRPGRSTARGNTADGGPLRFTRVVSRVFDGRSETSLDPDLRVFVSDLVRPYGLALREDLLQQGSGHSYGEMAEELLRATVPADQPVDLLVLAFAVPDVRPGRSTALYLSDLCPGDPLAFAVCDQGAAAAFTALRLARDYTRTGGCRRALVLVVEQAALHYEPAPRPGTGAPVPDRHTAVALLCERTGPAELTALRQHTDVDPGALPALLTAELTDLAAGRAEVVLILGPGLGPGLRAADLDTSMAAEVLLAPAGRPYTGLWSELADGLAGWSSAGRLVLLAEYDPALRYLCVSAMDTATAPAAGTARPLVHATGDAP